MLEIQFGAIINLDTISDCWFNGAFCEKKVNFDTYFLNIFHKTLIKLLLFR